MKDFIDKNKLIHSSQYDFCKAHSPDHAILDIVEPLQNNMDKHYFSCGVFIDLKKAFDTVNHKILLDNLIFMVSRDYQRVVPVVINKSNANNLNWIVRIN